MLLQPTAIGTLISLMEQAIRSYGVDPAPLLSNACIDSRQVDTPMARIAIRRITRLWSLAREATGDAAIGLRVARLMQPAHFHAVGLSWIAGRTLGASLERLKRYHDVVTMAFDLAIDRQPDAHRLVVILKPFPIAPESVDAFFASVLRLCRLVTGDAFAPRSVELRRANLGIQRVYEEAFRAPVEFSRPRDCIVFEPESLVRPVSGGNEALAAENARIADRYLVSLQASPTAERVRAALVELLPSGRADLGGVADHLHTSVSTLRRGLKREGTSYRSVLEETRRKLAEGYIEDPRISISDAAYLLGFAEQASFTRAFRRWTGTSPSRFRTSM